MAVVFSLAQTFFRKHKSGNLRRRFVKAVVGTFGLKVTAIVLSFMTSMLLTRLLGVTGYGIYSYAMALQGLLSVLATFGLDRLLTRNIAAYRAQSAWGLMRGLLRWTNQMSLLVAVVLSLFIAVILWILRDRLDPKMLETLWITLFLLPVTALVSLRRGAMHGLNHVAAGQLMEMCVRPVSFMLMVGCLYLTLEEQLSPSWAVGLHIIAMLIALMAGGR